jgi:hypothetical protein
MIVINKMMNVLKKYGFTKEANIVSKLFAPKQLEVEVSCPICLDDPDEDCVLCNGSGEIVSIVKDDNEDNRIQKELKIK